MNQRFLRVCTEKFVTPSFVLAFLAVLLLTLPASAQRLRFDPSGWQTNWDKHSIDLGELMSGGVPRDGIPPIDAPRFVSLAAAAEWLAPQEPVIALIVEGEARAYPLQILTWHEIVNDEVGGLPVAVTFCPLCYSALAFERRFGGTTYDFGVSGLLRHSDLVMYDRQTESLWQQLSGEAIVGDQTGTTLTQVPAQIVSFEQFRHAFPEGDVLSRETGHSRPYGQNPYLGYDDIDKKPFAFRGPLDDRLPPMEKVITVSFRNRHKAYPYSKTREERVIHDEVGRQPLVIFHGSGAVSALDAEQIRDAREVGSTGVFDPRLGDRTLRFTYQEGAFVDEQTGSTWDILGRATAGPLAGQQLTRLNHGDYFAFAWFAFRPETKVYR